MLGRRLVVGLFIVAVGFGLMHVAQEALQPVLGTEAVPPVIRLHVIPHSDGVKDQDAKLLVRDDVLSYLQRVEILAEETSAAGAAETLYGLLPELQRIAAETLSDIGMDHDVLVDLSVMSYDRPGPSEALPAGDYLALRIIIGAGGGRNFWCIVFPGLCFVPEPSLVQPAAAATGNVAHAASPPDDRTETKESAVDLSLGHPGGTNTDPQARTAGDVSGTNGAGTKEPATVTQFVEPTAKFHWRWAWLDRLFGN